MRLNNGDVLSIGYCASIPQPTITMVLSEDDKVIIQYLREKFGHGARKIVRNNPSKGWKVRTVTDFLQKLKDTGSRDRKPGSGRPRSARTSSNADAVEGLVLSQEGQPGTSLSERETARVIGISQSSVHRLIKDRLINTFKRVPVLALDATVKRKRAERCNKLLKRFKPCVVRRICFTDEKIFTVATPRNTQNDRVHSHAQRKGDVPEENLLRLKSRSRGSVMVSIGFTKEHKLRLVFVPYGAKINAATYQKEILEKMIPELQAKVPDFVFQQDGAPAHTARSTLDYLSAHCPSFIEPAAWPPCSPDLNPLDYYLWSALERQVYKGGQVKDVEDLKRRIDVAWEQFPQDDLARAIGKWRSRLQAVVAAEGGHIETFMHRH